MSAHIVYHQQSGRAHRSYARAHDARRAAERLNCEAISAGSQACYTVTTREKFASIMTVEPMLPYRPLSLEILESML